MARILILYSTTDGHTAKICHRIEEVIGRTGHQVFVSELSKEADFELEDFDQIVVGASIRYGKHSRQVTEFIRKHLSVLASKPSAFFSVNIVARKPEKNTPATNPYLRKFLQQIAWQPDLLAVFAGKLDYPKYGRLDRLMIRLIMKLTKGPTDPTTVIEFTDWKKVDEFARSLSLTQINASGRAHDSAYE